MPSLNLPVLPSSLPTALKRPVAHADAIAPTPAPTLFTAVPYELRLLMASHLTLPDFINFMAIDPDTRSVLEHSPEHEAAKAAYAASEATRKARFAELSQTMAAAWTPAMLHAAIGLVLAPLQDAKPSSLSFDRELAHKVFVNVIRIAENLSVPITAPAGIAIAEQLCHLSKYAFAAHPPATAEAERQLVFAWRHIAWSATQAKGTSRVRTIMTLATMVPICAHAELQAKPWKLLKDVFKQMIKGASNNVVKHEFKRMQAEVATLEKRFMRIRHAVLKK